MIYKGFELTCTQEELDAFLAGLVVNTKVCDFTETYNSVEIQNPTQDEAAKYYIIQVSGHTILQPHDPFQSGYAPITNENVDSILSKHKEMVIDSVVVAAFERRPEDKVADLEQQMAAEKAEKEQMKSQLNTLAETVDYLLGV